MTSKVETTSLAFTVTLSLPPGRGEVRACGHRRLNLLNLKKPKPPMASATRTNIRIIRFAMNSS